MICKNCSTENEQGAKFCSNCGESLKDYDNINTVLASEEDNNINTSPAPEQVAENPASAPVQPAPPVNSEPFGEYPSDNSASYNAQPAQPFQNPVPPVPPVPPYPPQAPPYAQPAPDFMGQMPPAYPPMPYGFQLADPYQGKATAAKVCGILSIVLPLISCGIFWLIGLILGVIGISMGASYQNKVFPQNRSKAKTGLICGIIGAIICIVIFILGLVLSKYMNSSEGQDIFRQFQEQFDTVIRPFIF